MVIQWQRSIGNIDFGTGWNHDFLVEAGVHAATFIGVAYDFWRSKRRYLNASFQIKILRRTASNSLLKWLNSAVAHSQMPES